MPSQCQNFIVIRSDHFPPNTGTGKADPSKKELKYKRRSVDDEWFTLEPVTEPENLWPDHYLTWKVKEFVFESKYF